jgi:hypothetical protein
MRPLVQHGSNQSRTSGLYHIPPDFVVERARSSLEASGREDLVAWGRARCSHEPVSPPPRRNRACDFHRTRLPRDRRLPLPALPLGLSGSSRSLPPPPSYGTMDCPEIHQGQDSYWTSTTSIPWRPSPRTQLSRAPSTMTPPTPMRFIGGQHPSPHGPPTFTLMPSAVTFRRWLTSDPSRSSRYPDRSAGISGLPLTSLRLACQTGQSRSSFGICNTIGCGRCPIRQGLEAGVPFPVGLSPLRLLAMGLFSQAPHLGGLPRASRVPFRGSYFTSDCLHPTRRPKGSSSACTGDGVFHSWHQCASWRTQIEEPITGG